MLWSFWVSVGDRIEVWAAPVNSATWGDVVEIGLRATKIRTTDNLIIVIPNNEIMRRDIVNYTASGSHIRLRIPVSIAYNADSEKDLYIRAMPGDFPALPPAAAPAASAGAAPATTETPGERHE
jgi:hypothetical protein